MVLIFLLSVNFLFAQEIELSIQSGHSNLITALDLSPDARFIASSSKDKRIIIWDRKTQKQFMTLIGHNGYVTDVLFTSDGKRLYSVSKDKSIIEWEIPSGKILSKIETDQGINVIVRNDNSGKLYVGGEKIMILNKDLKIEKEIFLNSVQIKQYLKVANDPKLQKTERGKKVAKNALSRIKPSTIVDLKLNKDGSELAYTDAAGITNVVYLTNDKQVEISKKFINAVEFDENEQLFTAESNGRVAKHYWNSLKVKRRRLGLGNLEISSLHLVGKKLHVITSGGEMLVLNRNTLHTEKKRKICDAKLTTVSYFENKNLALVAGSNGLIYVLKLDDLTIIETYCGNVNRINDILFSNDGKTIYALYYNGEVRSFNFITLNSETVLPRISDSRLDKNSELVAGQLYFNSKNNLIVESSILKRSPEYYWVPEKITDVKGEISDFTNNIFPMSPTSKFTYSKEFMDSIYHHIKFGAPPMLNKNNLKIDPTFSKDVSDLTKSNCEKLNFKHDDIITSIVANPKGNFIASASWDGIIKFWDKTTSKLVLIVGLFPNNQFIFITPENYYFSSKESLKHVGFRFNNEVYSFDQFDLLYNRPDIVLKALEGLIPSSTIQLYESAYKKRLKRLNISPDSLKISKDVPEMELEIQERELTSNSCLLKIKSSSQSKLTRLMIEVNGVPEFKKNGLDLDCFKLDTSISVLLNSGKNVIKCYVTNSRNISSYTKENIVYSTMAEVKGQLFVVSIGASKYQQSEFNLSYASKDAEDIVHFFEQSNKYEKVNLFKLTNEQVTRESIDSAQKFTAQAGVHDKVLLFAAGHGVLSSELDYYFGAWDIDFKTPENRGIPYEWLENVLNSSKSRYKLMFLDACHSGEIDKEEVQLSNASTPVATANLKFRAVGNSIQKNTSTSTSELSRMLFADLKSGAGSTIISSAGGGEFAFEGDEWNNGVFTYCLLSGLKNRKADLNSDGVIMISELHKYITRQVSEKTNGNQKPTSRTENIYNDYEVH